MVQWLLSLPRPLFVFLVLTTAILFILFNDPPHTICRVQINQFKSWQEGLIYKARNDKLNKKPLMQTLMKTCKDLAEPGACYGLFSRIKVFIRDFHVVSEDCKMELSELPAVKKTLLSVYDLMIRLAWGDEPPDVRKGQKFNWLSALDRELFCSVKQKIISLYGEQTLSAQEQKTFLQLPGADSLKTDDIQDRSLVSQYCSM